jgi:hypothetical protein
MYLIDEIFAPEFISPLPVGEVGAQRRVRDYGA